MRRWNQKVLIISCAALLMTGAAGVVMAQSPTIVAGSVSAEPEGGPGVVIGGTAQEISKERTCVWGPVLSVSADSVVIDNQSGVSSAGEMVLWVTEDTLLLESEHGFPVALSELKEGSIVSAYIADAMTMSLPPQVQAKAVILGSEEQSMPLLAEVESMEPVECGWNMEVDGRELFVAEDCAIMPYLTRNIVSLEDVKKGSRVLVWEKDGQVEKLVLFS